MAWYWFSKYLGRYAGGLGQCGTRSSTLGMPLVQLLMNTQLLSLPAHHISLSSDLVLEQTFPPSSAGGPVQGNHAINLRICETWNSTMCGLRSCPSSPGTIASGAEVLEKSIGPWQSLTGYRIIPQMSSESHPSFL